MLYNCINKYGDTMKKQISFIVNAEDHKGIKIGAAKRNLSVREFIMRYLRKGLEAERDKNNGENL